MNAKRILISLAGIAVCCGVILTANYGLGPVAQQRAEAEQLKIMQLLTGGETFTKQDYAGDDENIRAVYATETGYLIETVTKGYADDITMWVGVSSEGEVNGVMVRDMHETAGLGLRAFTDGEFFIQTMGAAGDLEVGTNADAITGATVTSRALVKGINSACAFVTGAEIESGATEWEG